ncbi:MAG TPA: bifunctional pyr operon transcriptional regulator/uracil phosphoribosyltransferase PyrR [Gammaproteobacteria bacterium]|nr:bifunctional pyr operon transcriptional regulator/uracil phosphoribosyltransferase PyrR [Gammaproteobacteria bacterium]
MTGTIEVETLLEGMAQELRTLLQQRGITDPAMVGIHTGGVWVARELHRRMDIAEELGSLDISFYRDDFTRIGMNPQVRPSDLPFNVDDRHIILVDDVLHTGRTIRAALNELFDYGRPASIILAALVERGGRELPIEANVVGQSMDLRENEHVKLTGPDPLTLEIQQLA